MRKIFLTALFLIIPTISYSQVVVNPTKAIFTASVDHNTTENGVDIITSYELRIYTLSGTIPLKTMNLNKPNPDFNNVIEVNISSTVVTLPVGDYVARVAAKGPGGENNSEISNTFQVAVRPPTAPTKVQIIK